MTNTNRQGVLLAVAAYVMWGIAPVYFKLIESVPSVEILMHRIIWSLVVLFLIISGKKHWHNISKIFRNPKTLLTLTISSCFLAFNWWLFIWAVNNERILDASLGYYINPLLNIALGMIFLGERLSRLQYFAIGLALIGVLIQLITFGSFPIVAFSLAASFAIYGLIRKKIHVDSVSGIFIESLILVIPAILYWWFLADSHASNLTINTVSLNMLLVLAGVVTTAPLLCFVAAARRLEYSTMGFLQYIGPSIMFLFGVFVYGENVGQDRWLTFAFIWSALAVYSFATIQKIRKK